MYEDSKENIPPCVFACITYLGAGAGSDYAVFYLHANETSRTGCIY